MNTKQLLIERVNKIIRETSGINDELDWNIYSISKEIINSFKKQKDFSYDNNLKYKSITIEKTIVEKPFTIQAIAVYFDNDEEYNSYIQKYGGFQNGFVKLGKTYYVKVFLIVINDIPKLDDFYDSIYHEAEHAFQTVKMKKDFGGDDLNAFIKTKLYSNNVYERKIAEIIYGTRQNEQDAMVNGMWGYIKNNLENDETFNISIDKYILNSEASTWLMKLYQNYSFIIKNKNNPDFIKALSEYKMFSINYRRLVSITKYGIKRLENKIALVTRKLKQRFIKEYHIHYDIKKGILDENKNFYCLKII